MDYFSGFSTKFTQNIANHVAQPQYNLDTKFSQNVEIQIANPLYRFWEPVWVNYSENNESAFRLRWPEYLFMIFPQLYASLIMWQWVKFPYLSRVLFRRTLRSKHAIWKKAYMRDTKTKISVKTLYIFTDHNSYKLWEDLWESNFNRNILFLECSKKDQTYISNILTLFEHIILRIKILKKRR